MLTHLLIIVLSFLALIKGADWLVDGSSSIAKKLGIPAIVIGLTIIAFGTSAPELVVNVMSSINGANEIAIGNILGSNIANILLILGIAAIISQISVKTNTAWKEVPFALLGVVVLMILANDRLIDHVLISSLSRIDGLILICFFIIFLYYIFGIAKLKGEETPIKTYKTWQSILMVIGGFVGLILGGKFVVDSAVAIATSLGVSQALIGLTIVAIGTSLPELVTSAVAAYKKQSDIAIGNVVGSNIFNIFWILGLSAIIKPLPFTAELNQDLFITTAVTLLLFSFIFIGKKFTIQRWQGISFIGIYIAYIIFLIIRG